MKQRLFGRPWRLTPVVGAAVLLAMLAMPLLVLALSVAGSNFEIDENANLKVDATPPTSALDWASVDNIDEESRQTDAPSGAADNSFTQGSKEDTPVPTVEFGSIPPNKSDLKTFGVYQEENADGKFLHLFWSRVQDPSGTTNMDFEFNQSSTLSANGVTPVRTVDDLLITYDLARGGTVPTISIRYWNGSAWGPAQDLTASGIAVGSINSSLIPAGESDGLGALDPRTFGEASIGLDAAFGNGECRAFGSAFLKSRSSDSFTAALKDFIAPIGINVSNCGGITIVKDAVPNDVQDFHYSVSGPSGFSDSFDLDDDGNGTPSNTRLLSDLFAGTYTFTEDAVSGWNATGLTCVDDNTGLPFGGADIDDNNRIVAVTIEADDEVTCTFVNTKQGKIIVAKQTNPDGSTQSFEFDPSYGSNFSLSDGQTNDSGFLAPGTYSVAETVPTGWDLTDTTCSDGSAPGSISLAAGETVTCTFTNTQRGKIIVAKLTVPSGSSQSFEFDSSYGPNFFLSHGGSHDSGFIVPGTYSVAETVPTGWDLTSSTCDDGSSPGNIVLGPGETVTCTFTNTQRGKIIVEKQTDPDGSPQEFEFDPSYGSNFFLSDDESNTSAFLVPGNYSVSEQVPAGWELTSATCDDGSAITNIVLGAGEIVTCTFNNTQGSQITVVKQTNPDGSPQEFEFDPSYGSNFFLSDGESMPSGTLSPGIYSVAELVPAGWSLSSATCSDGSNPGSINLSAGESVTCTFTNTEKFVVIVLVCHQGAGGLYPSSVTDGVLTETSLSNAGFTSEQITLLCGLQGARFTDLTAGVTPYSYDATIPHNYPE